MSKPRFTFTLEPLRMLRKHAEETALQELSSELDLAAAARRDVDAAERRLAGACTAAATARLTAAELEIRQSYLERVERELAESRRRDSAQQACVEASRVRVQDTAREREMLDRVAARRRREHELERLRHERRLSDEIALLARGPLSGRRT